MKSTKGNVDWYYFWNTNFWTFGFQTPPTPSPPLKQDSDPHPKGLMGVPVA